MTVRELIEKLQHLPANAVIARRTHFGRALPYSKYALGRQAFDADIVTDGWALDSGVTDACVFLEPPDIGPEPD